MKPLMSLHSNTNIINNVTLNICEKKTLFFFKIITLGHILPHYYTVTGSMVISIYKTFKRGYTHLQELQQDMRIWLKGSHQNMAIMIKNKN